MYQKPPQETTVAIVTISRLVLITGHQAKQLSILILIGK